MTEKSVLRLWLVVCLTTVGLWWMFSADLRRQLDRAQAIQQQTLKINEVVEDVLRSLDRLEHVIEELAARPCGAATQ